VLQTSLTRTSAAMQFLTLYLGNVICLAGIMAATYQVYLALATQLLTLMQELWHCKNKAIPPLAETPLQHLSGQGTPVDSLCCRQPLLSNPVAATEQVPTCHAGITAVPQSVHVPSLGILQWPQSPTGPLFLPPTACVQAQGSVPQ